MAIQILPLICHLTCLWFTRRTMTDEKKKPSRAATPPPKDGGNQLNQSCLAVDGQGRTGKGHQQVPHPQRSPKSCPSIAQRMYPHILDDLLTYICLMLAALLEDQRKIQL